MKLITITLICIFLISTSYSQDQSQILKFKKDFYMERGKKQNKAGWILLGGGAALAAIGEIAYAARINKSDDVWDQIEEVNKYTFTDVLGTIGYVSVVASIPLFISGGVNKKKAKRVSLSITNQNYYKLQNNTLSLKPLPVLKLQLHL